MAFSGRYELQRQENFVPFMKAIGIPDDLIEKGKDLKSVSEIVQTGDHFKVTVTKGNKVIVNEFTIGEEMEVQSPTGEQIKALVNAEGSNKLVVKMQNITSVTELIGDQLIIALVNAEGSNKLVVKMQNITSVTELIGDQLIITMTIGDIDYKRISRRIS